MTAVSRIKVCSTCGEEKALEEFSNRSASKDGKQPKCKACVKQYHQANKERRSEYNREHYQANKEYYREYRREYYQANKERRSEYNREYYQANKERQLEYRREYRQANKEYYREYQKERRASDPLFALANRCRRRIHHALKSKGFSKDCTTAEMLGCTYEELMTHLESQFTDGITWENRGEWQIDHIVPLASAETEEELLALSHYTNLQPLWAKDNISKGAKHG